MALTSLAISGLRSFGESQTLSFARPNGTIGSGLTVVVGPNGGGKSTLVEALSLMTINGPPSVDEAHRAVATRQIIELELRNDSGGRRWMRTVEGSGGSFAVQSDASIEASIARAMLLPSRRSFPHRFGGNDADRSGYMTLYRDALFARGVPLAGFPARLNRAVKHKLAFNAVLERLLDTVPEWTVEKAADGNFYLKFFGDSGQFTSEGLGDGILALFFVADALYDARPGDLVVIDEPELSMHPALQRRLGTLLLEFAAEHQVVLVTHSPYFVRVEALGNGAKIVRVHQRGGQTRLRELDEAVAREFAALSKDRNNPHVTDLSAREVFFLDERVILVEGQEDVVCYPDVARQLDLRLSGSFFGWGVGGAPKMPIVARLLQQLGFEKVAGILDADQEGLLSTLSREFPGYHFGCIPARDVRHKRAQSARDARLGLLDPEGMLHPHFREATARILSELASYLERP